MSGRGMRAALARMVQAGAARRRAAIAEALAEIGGAEMGGAEMGGAVAIEGDAVRASGRGLRERWWRDLALREAGRNGL